MRKINLDDAFPPVDEGFERGMSRAFEAIRKEKVMRHRMKYTLLAAALIILALAGTAVATGFNVIEFFAQSDKRLERIASGSAVETSAPARVESEALGSSGVWFDSAYFDGDTLIVGFVMENTERMEAFTPTEEQLSTMNREKTPFLPVPRDEAEASLVGALSEAMERGEPCGLAAYSVYPSDHIRTEDGVDVGPGSGDETVTDEGWRLLLREMETPLPEEIRNRDSLELHMVIWRQTARYWFDGEALYTSHERQQAEEAVTTVTRSAADTRDFAGEGVYDGIPVTVSAHATKLRVTLAVEAETDVFLNRPDLWYDCLLLDDQGRALDVDSVDVSPRRLAVSFFGDGEMPEGLEAYILALTEEEWNEWDADRLKESVESIILTPVA